MMALNNYIVRSCMGSCMGKKKVRDIIEISRTLIKICGAEGVRTLVQLCDKLCLLHAYFPINCRDGAGW